MKAHLFQLFHLFQLITFIRISNTYRELYGSIYLQEFDIHVTRHVPSVVSHADVLSRVPTKYSSNIENDFIITRIEICVT